MTTRNLYLLQTRDKTDYVYVSRQHANSLIETERAEWIGTDYDEKRDVFVHYADRIDP